MSRPSLKRAMSEANQLASAWHDRENLYAPPSIVEQRIAEQFDGKIRRVRIRLDVPYADKDKAKALGARWDSVERTWYCYTLTDALRRWKHEGDAEYQEVHDKAASNPRKGRSRHGGKVKAVGKPGAGVLARVDHPDAPGSHVAPSTEPIEPVTVAARQAARDRESSLIPRYTDFSVFVKCESDSLPWLECSAVPAQWLERQRRYFEEFNPRALQG